MKLIVNADDLGFSKGINYGILDAYRYGIVRSTSLMMNMATTDHAIDLLKSSGIGIGVHLNATAGKPLLKHRHIVDEEGHFKKQYEFTIEELEEIRNEFIAQIQSAFDKGLQVTHLDSHHHIHLWNEEIFSLVKALGQNYGLKMRVDGNYTYMTSALRSGIQTTEAFSQEFFDKTVYVETLMDIIGRNSDKDSLEIMVHPGFLCGNLYGRDSYREMRMVEHSILTSSVMKRFIEDQGIELIHFGQL